MRYVLVGIVVIVFVVVGALLAVPALVPADTVKEQIARAVGDATGRDVTINGEVSVSLLPRLKLELNDVALANVPGADNANMATLKQLIVQLRVLPLIRREVAVDRFVLVEPVINLEIDAGGHANWTFAAADSAPVAPAGGAARSGGGQEAAGGGAGLGELSLGEVQFVDGIIRYVDARQDTRYTLEGVNLTVSLSNLDSPLTAVGGARLNGQDVALNLGVEAPRALLAGGVTAVEAAIQSDRVALTYQGSLARDGGGRTAGGTVVLDVPSIAQLGQWLDVELGAAAVVERVSIAGDVALRGTRFAFTNARIGLDDMTATGDLAIDTSGAKPSLQGSLSVDRLDVNKFLPAPAVEPAGRSAPAEGQTVAPAGTASPGWSDAPIDVSGLQAANVDLALEAGGILFREMKIGPSAVDLKLVDGLLTVDLTRLELYGGSGDGRVVVDGRGAAPAIDSRFALAGVQAMPLLRDATGFRLIEGGGSLEFTLSTAGQSQRAMVSALDGNGTVKFVDGAINGINLAAMVRNVTSAFAAGAAAQKTDFAELSGTFTITDGSFANSDLLLLNPLVRLTGAGTADLPNRTVSYRLEPKVVASLEGQGGAADAGGLTVPVIVEGPWDDLSYRPDLAGLATQILDNPQAAVGSVTRAVEGVSQGGAGVLGEVLESVTGGGGEGGGLPDVGDALKGLLGR